MFDFSVGYFRHMYLHRYMLTLQPVIASISSLKFSLEPHMFYGGEKRMKNEKSQND